MKNFRIIPRLEIKSEFLVKGMIMEGLKKIGDPSDFSKNYFKDNADEIFFEDIVASLYNRKIDLNLVKKISSLIQIPLTIAGRIRNLNDAHKVFQYGADKISINTNALKKPKLLSIEPTPVQVTALLSDLPMRIVIKSVKTKIITPKPTLLINSESIYSLTTG